MFEQLGQVSAAHAERFAQEAECVAVVHAPSREPIGDRELARAHVVESISLNPIYTPGHTGNHMAYAVGDRVLTDDALLTRLGGGKSEQEFVKIMSEPNLQYPKFIDYVVPGNRDCGVCPESMPAHLQQYCGDMEDSPPKLKLVPSTPTYSCSCSCSCPCSNKPENDEHALSSGKTPQPM